MKILRQILQKIFKKPIEQNIPEEIVCYQHGRWIRIVHNHKLVWEGPIDFMPREAKEIYLKHNKHVSWVHGEQL